MKARGDLPGWAPIPVLGATLGVTGVSPVRLGARRAPWCYLRAQSASGVRGRAQSGAGVHTQMTATLYYWRARLALAVIAASVLLAGCGAEQEEPVMAVRIEDVGKRIW